MLINWFTVLAQVVNFLILVFLLKRFLYGPIIKAMDERERKIAAAMEQAKNAEKEAKQRSQELENEKQSLIAAKEGLLAEATKEVQEWRERTLIDAKKEVEKLRRAWTDKLAQDKQAFLERLKIQITDQVMRVSEKVLRDLADEGMERRVIKVFVEKLNQEKEVIQAKGEHGTLVVKTGFELEETASGDLRKHLAKSIPEAQAVRFEVDPKLGIGIQLSIGDQKVAWNLTAYLEELEEEIMAEL